MSIIYSYPEQGALNANDMLIGTSAEKVGGKQKNITRNFTVQQIADFINQGTGFVDPVASDFQIPVFNQGGKKITGSIISQNTSPSNGSVGSAITIAGSLTTTGAISTVSNLTASGIVTLGSQANLISLNSNTRLNGPILDVAGNTGLANQILISNGTGNVYWQNYEAGLTYEGTWNASTNTPTLTSGQGVSGHFYIVSVAGNTNLDGNNDWHIGDWAVFFDAGGGGNAAWQKIDNTSVLTGNGTANTLAMWTATETLNDSLLSQDVGATKVIVDGLLEVKGDGASQDGRIKLNCSQNSHGVTIQSPPHSAGASYTLVLPTSVGTSGQALTTDGSDPAQLSWTTLTTGTVTGTGTQNYVTKWSTGGTGIENSTIFDNGTNVGIGTTSPAAKLDVAGDILSTGDITIDNSTGDPFLKLKTNAQEYVLRIDQSDGEKFQIRDITNSLTPFTINTAGNVGIGTTSPGSYYTGANNLVINNDSGSGLTIASNDTSDGSIYFADGTSGASAYAGYMEYNHNSDFFRIGVDASEAMRIDSSGSVGIGTITPTATLHVAGDNGFATSKPTMISESVLTVKPITASSGNLNFASINGGAGVGLQYTNGPGTADWDIALQPFGGNVGIGTISPGEKLSVSGNSNITGKLAIGSTSSHASYDFYNQNTSYFNGAVTLDSTFTQTGGGNSSFSGNIGIGTTSPSVSLDISATDAVQMPVGITTDRPSTGVSNGMLRYNSTNNEFEGYINGNWGSIGGGASGGLIFRGTFNAATGAIAGGGSLYTCPAGGSGGTVDTAIGDLYIVTTAGSFFCSGTSLNVGDEVICITAATATNDNVNNWNAIASGAGGAVTGSGTTNYVPKFTGATVVGNSSIFNDSSGSVGIGTASPGAKLEVNSNGSSDSVFNLNASDNRGASRYAFLLTDTDTNGRGAMLVNATSGFAASFNGGNVGIGTTSPSAKLDVRSNDPSIMVAADNASGISSLILRGLGSNGTSNAYTEIKGIPEGGGAASSLSFDTRNSAGTISEKMRIDSDGKVGIGTNTPDTMLHVESNTDLVSPILTIENDNAKQVELGVVRAAAGSEPNTSFLAYDNDLRFIAGSGTTNEVVRITSNGKVGIGTNQPQVSLDLGNNTDAIRVPNGAQADRPSGILPGMIRYNTSSHEFEGYSGTVGVSGSWGALGGGAPTITKQLFTVTTAQSIFTLTAGVNPQDANYVNIFIDGVYQNSGTYTVATATGTTTVTLNTAAPVGTSVEIISTT